MKRKILLITAMMVAVICAAQQTIVVKAGDAKSFLDAIAKANELNAKEDAPRTVILLPDGLYDLGETVLTTITGHNISIVGQSTEKTIVRNAPDVKTEGISKTATLRNRGTNLYLQDLTLKNDLKYYESGSAGRAVCLQDKGTRTICNRVCMLSYQDTYYSDNEDMQSYMHETEIHGTVDFICGAGDVYFDHCKIVTEPRTIGGKGRCVIAAPRTSRTPWGYIFESCTIENRQSSFTFARGWHTTPHCIMLRTKLMSPEKLEKDRFDHRGMRTVKNDFHEYGTVDAQGNNITPKSNVVIFTLKEETNPVETIITQEQAAKYTLANVFPNWEPAKLMKKYEKRYAKLKKRQLR